MVITGLNICNYRSSGQAKELREEVGVKDSVKRKLLRSRLKWAGHVE